MNIYPFEFYSFNSLIIITLKERKNTIVSFAMCLKAISDEYYYYKISILSK